MSDLAQQVVFLKGYNDAEKSDVSKLFRDNPYTGYLRHAYTKGIASRVRDRLKTGESKRPFAP